MAFMRVPSLDEEFGRDAAMMLNTLGWGKSLLGRALGRDDDGRLVSFDVLMFGTHGIDRQAPFHDVVIYRRSVRSANGSCCLAGAVYSARSNTCLLGSVYSYTAAFGL